MMNTTKIWLNKSKNTITRRQDKVHTDKYNVTWGYYEKWLNKFKYTIARDKIEYRQFIHGFPFPNQWVS
jgi:hypothetical protein